MAKGRVQPKVAAEQKSAAPLRVGSLKNRVLGIFDKLRQNTSFRLAVLWLCGFLIFLSFLFTTVLSEFSYLEIFPRELIFPSLMYACTSLLAALAVYWLPVLRSFFAKLVAAVIMTLLLIGYDSGLQALAGPIQALVPGLTDSDPLYLTSILYLLMLFAIAVWAGWFAGRLVLKQHVVKPRDLQFGMLVLVGYLFLVPVFSLADILPAMVRETAVQAPEFSTAGKGAATDKPDVYYIVLDRYGSADMLRKQFNFDNGPFTGYLRDNGFYVNDNAHSNYPYTALSISSTINADYTNQLTAPFKDNAVQNRTLFHNLVWQSSVVKAFKQEGYKYYTVNSRYGLSYKAPLADEEFVHEHVLKIFGKAKVLHGIEALEFLKSPYYRLSQIPSKAWPLKIEDTTQIAEVKAQLNSLENLAAQKPGGRFIFAHLLIPHNPYYFNADGSLAINPSADNAGKAVKDKYVNQVEFINTQMRDLLDAVRKQSDGKSVVILNADEGPYPQIANSTFKKSYATSDESEGGIADGSEEDMRKWSDDWLRMKFGILQAAHIPKATDDDLGHLSSVNAFRIVMNRYLGYELPYLPQCQFGLTEGVNNFYQYADITDRFTATPDPDCKKLQSL